MVSAGTSLVQAAYVGHHAKEQNLVDDVSWSREVSEHGPAVQPKAAVEGTVATKAMSAMSATKTHVEPRDHRDPYLYAYAFNGTSGSVSQSGESASRQLHVVMSPLTLILIL